MFNGYHLDVPIPENAEVAYCLTPSLLKSGEARVDQCIYLYQLSACGVLFKIESNTFGILLLINIYSYGKNN